MRIQQGQPLSVSSNSWGSQSFSKCSGLYVDILWKQYQKARSDWRSDRILPFGPVEAAEDPKKDCRMLNSESRGMALMPDSSGALGTVDPLS